MSPLAKAPRMADCIAYQRYADEVLAPLKRIKELEAEGKYDTEGYDSLLVPYYERHVLRQPMESWPECVVSSLEHANKDLHVYMQGPNIHSCSSTKLQKYQEDGHRFFLPKRPVTFLLDEW